MRPPDRSTRRLKLVSTVSCTSGSKARQSFRSAIVPRSAPFTGGVSKSPAARPRPRSATCRWWRRSEPEINDTAGTKRKRPATFPPPAVILKLAEAILLDVAQIGGERELTDEGRAAPARARKARLVDWRERDTSVGMITGKSVAIGLAQVGIVVAQIERERLVGERYAGVPGPVALVRNSVRKRCTAGPGGAG